MKSKTRTHYTPANYCHCKVCSPVHGEMAFCWSCEEIATTHKGFGPRHVASVYCLSGKHPHCTCDTCF